MELAQILLSVLSASLQDCTIIYENLCSYFELKTRVNTNFTSKNYEGTVLYSLSVNRAIKLHDLNLNVREFMRAVRTLLRDLHVLRTCNNFFFLYK